MKNPLKRSPKKAKEEKEVKEDKTVPQPDPDLPMNKQREFRT